MRDSDWSRETLLRSDWLGLIVASMTTIVVLVSVWDRFLVAIALRFFKSFVILRRMPGECVLP